MQRTSGSIASLAAALAKAQIELANPEKSLVGTIEPAAGEGSARLFRYASLSSGLEIVRKTLGQHEIATVQTTAIDQTAGIVNLTTVLAHASGEWIASDWPVCAIADTATPHRMGTALTYARRYALFTLVGIAGEDDLDAPDLLAPAAPEPGKPKGTHFGNGRLSGGGQDRPLSGGRSHAAQQNSVHHRGSAREAVSLPALAPKEASQLRDRLLAELGHLSCSDDAALWAHRSLPEKNRLTAADAQCIEAAFQARLASLVAPDAEEANLSATAVRPMAVNRAHRNNERRRPPSRAIDKCVLALPEPRRVRDRDHVHFVARQPCLVCGRSPADAHHLRHTQSRALGRKVSDEFTVPLCRGHHREVHRCGNEAAWWGKTGIDPGNAARSLWLETHPLPTDQTVRRGPTPAEASGQGDQAKSKRRRRGARRRTNDKTKPILAAAAQ